ncbi:IQ motif and SEC7 domain-containing protein 2 [Chrysoperla carnea]|uniref:IQ motif and SEC7 domain-containing protein 2 n=1 Tax=Chrysoperla carnea TaxID=189513 RepID=UPI001D09687E|nr:IQ motif and SEC7 domain-containing protein 2 [Chrysoperla carnea]
MSTESGNRVGVSGSPIITGNGILTNNNKLLTNCGPPDMHKYVTAAQKDELIKEQFQQICKLKKEVDGLISERDLLLCEVSNLRFELEMAELKRIQDESFPHRMERTSSVAAVTMFSPGQTYVPSQSYIQAQNYQVPTYPNIMKSYPGSETQNVAFIQSPTPTIHKQQSIRNVSGEMKRNRTQTGYELSQDLLDKQIEMLERKYGGVKARKAALTIQRAFRRYTLLKKFAAITAMAKAEKRLCRRLPNMVEATNESLHMNSVGAPIDPNRRVKSPEGDHTQTYANTYEACNNINNNPSSRPVRSMSLRERRNLDMSQLPRSQSGTATTCWGNYVGTYYVQRQDNINEDMLNSPVNVSSCKVCSPSGGIPPNIHWTRTPESSYSGVGGPSTPNNVIYAQARINPQSSPQTPQQLMAQQSAQYQQQLQAQQSASAKKIPPEVPKRTSSISSKSMEPRSYRTASGGLSKCADNGSLSSVQSSGSDSSISTDRVMCGDSNSTGGCSSPLWKRKGLGHSQSPEAVSESSLIGISHTSASVYALEQPEQPMSTPISYKVSETVRKRQYRVGLNLFNKKPERGITYLMRRGFLENSPEAVARFLISRKGLSKQMIGEYLGNLQNQFNMAVLECFARELDLSGMQVDVALRKFQAYFRMPGEAQKIERLMEVFSQRYCQCNIDIVTRLRSPDTIFVLAFAIIMLNTDLHTPNLKPERRMRLDDFIKNLRGIDDCGDIDRDMLVGIYERVKANEFKPSSDHVTQVIKVQATIVGKKPNMVLPHRRLVCYCRLYEIPDINKKERPGVHQREVFLFNDLLVITKILSKKKSSVTYTFRQSFSLCGMVVTLFEVPHYPFGIRLAQRVDDKVLITFNARNEHDRCKFAEDLRESVYEMDEMENLRIEAELERQKSSRGGNRSGAENRDSGVADVEICSCTQGTILVKDGNGGDRTVVQTQQPTNEQSQRDAQLKRTALSNSLLDIHDQFTGEKPQRRGSVGSLDSGMSVSFQPTSSSTLSRIEFGQGGQKPKPMNQQQSFLGGLFHKRERKLSRTEDPTQKDPFIRSTEV